MADTIQKIEKMPEKKFHRYAYIGGKPDPRIQGGQRMNSDKEIPSERALPVRSRGEKRTPSYKRGGRVRKTGPALLHRGEKVRAGKRRGKRMSGRS